MILIAGSHFFVRSCYRWQVKEICRNALLTLFYRALGRWLLALSLLFFCFAFTFPKELRSSLGEPPLTPVLPLNEHSHVLKIGEQVQQELSIEQINDILG